MTWDLKSKNLLLILCLALASPVLYATDAGTPAPEMMSKLYPGKTYSPYAQRSFPSNVYWGDTHLHTSLSLDAGLFGNILGHEDAAWREAKRSSLLPGCRSSWAGRSTGW